MSEMVERVAVAICKQRGWDFSTDAMPGGQEQALAESRAAIAAMREPTTAMNDAGYFDAEHSIESVGDLAPPPGEQPRLIWQAMNRRRIEVNASAWSAEPNCFKPKAISMMLERQFHL